MAVYIVTGGAGFIGSNLAEKLVALKHSVHIIDNLSGGKKENIPNGAAFHNIDIRNLEKIRTLFKKIKKCDGIFHLAALPRVQFSIKNPLETHDVNVTGLLNILIAANEQGNIKVVYSASSSAYGDSDILPLHEGLPTNPKSPYGLQKLIGEQYCKTFNEVYELPTVSLRYFNVFGPQCDPNGPYALVIGKFIQQRIDGKPMTVTGNGSQTRDITHVSDVVRANIMAMEATNVSSGETINIGSGKNISIKALAELIEGPIDYIASRLEPHDTLADISRAKVLLGWEPLKDFKEGVDELKKYMGLT